MMNKDYLLNIWFGLQFDDLYLMNVCAKSWLEMGRLEGLAFAMDSIVEFDYMMEYHGCLDSGLI